MRIFALACAAALLWGGVASAFDPTAAIGGPYKLKNQFGERRTEVSPDGHAQLVFFGYVNCPDICTAAMPLMADIADDLGEEGLPVTPIMITVDPEVDTPDSMIEPLAKLHKDFIGLTGSKRALKKSYDAFQVEITPLFTDPAGQTIFAHGSFLYLLDADGNLLTLIPPILDADRAIDIVRGYLDGSKEQQS